MSFFVFLSRGRKRVCTPFLSLAGKGNDVHFLSRDRKGVCTPFLSLVRKKPGTLKESTNKGEGIGFPFPLKKPPTLKPLKGTLRSLENPSATCFLGGRQ